MYPITSISLSRHARPLFSSFLLLDRYGGPSLSGTTDPVRDSRSYETGRSREELVRSLAERLADQFVTETGAPGHSPAALVALESALSGQSVILQLTSEVAGPRREAVRVLLETMLRLSSTLDSRRQEEAIIKLADVIIPDDLEAARGVLAVDNLKLRDRFLAEVPTLTSAEVGNRAGQSKVNLHATAARWRKSNDVLSVHHRGAERYLAFQFQDNGRPHPTIKKALVALPRHLSPWQRAFWFTSTNGWLGDKAPCDMLDDPKAVVAAAEREAEEVMG